MSETYEGLLPEHAVYHKLGPKDIAFGEKPVMTVDVARQTNNTGEQIHINVPVYADDSRESMMNRIHMAYSILQERLEDENKAMQRLNDKIQEKRLTEIAQKKALEAERIAAKKNKGK